MASLRWFNSSGGPYLTSAAQRLHPSMSSMPVNCHWSLEIGCRCRCWHCSLHQPRTPRGARLPCSLPSRPVVAVAVKGSSSLRADHAMPACMRPPESFAPAPLFTAVHTHLHASIRRSRLQHPSMILCMHAGKCCARDAMSGAGQAGRQACPL